MVNTELTNTGVFSLSILCQYLANRISGKLLAFEIGDIHHLLLSIVPKFMLKPSLESNKLSYQWKCFFWVTVHYHSFSFYEKLLKIHEHRKSLSSSSPRSFWHHCPLSYPEFLLCKLLQEKRFTCNVVQENVFLWRLVFSFSQTIRTAKLLPSFLDC